MLYYLDREKNVGDNEYRALFSWYNALDIQLFILDSTLVYGGNNFYCWNGCTDFIRLECIKS